jgi:hypothetical protein
MRKPTPRIFISVSGGMVQGTRANVDIDVEIFDWDNLKADGFTSGEIEQMWEEATIETDHWT